MFYKYIFLYIYIIIAYIYIHIHNIYMCVFENFLWEGIVIHLNIMEQSR